MVKPSSSPFLLVTFISISAPLFITSALSLTPTGTRVSKTPLHLGADHLGMRPNLPPHPKSPPGVEAVRG